MRSSTHNCTVLGRQAFQSLLIHVELQIQATFPPAWVVVERRHLVETQLQIVVWADPLCGVDGAFFQALVDFAARNVLWHATHALDHLASKAAHAELQALDVFRRLHFLAEPAAHLRAGVATQEVHDVVLSIKLAHQLGTVAIDHPGCELAGVHAERNRTANGKRFVLAEEIVRSRVSDFDRTVLNAIHHAKRGHQFACGVHGHFKLSARHFLDGLGKHIRRAIDGVQRLGEAGCQAPANGGLGMHCWSNAGSEHAGDTGLFDQGTTIHGDFPSIHMRFWHMTGPKKTGICAAGCTAQATGSKNKTGSAKTAPDNTVTASRRSCNCQNAARSNEPTAVGHAGRHACPGGWF